MLYFVLGLAVVLYASLFWLWGALAPHLGASASRLSVWRQMIVGVPDHTALILLKELIVLTLIYLAFDGARSLIRLALHHKAARPSWHDYPSDAAPHDGPRS